MVSSPGTNFLKKDPASEHAPVPDIVCVFPETTHTHTRAEAFRGNSQRALLVVVAAAGGRGRGGEGSCG
jgi:hypothetical protein